MDSYTIAEEAYKNGYARGYEDCRKKITLCEHCAKSDTKLSPRGRVWCQVMCRYMKLDGYCSEGETERHLSIIDRRNNNGI